jgi:hypothetical protein
MDWVESMARMEVRNIFRITKVDITNLGCRRNVLRIVFQW